MLHVHWTCIHFKLLIDLEHFHDIIASPYFFFYIEVNEIYLEHEETTTQFLYLQRNIIIMLSKFS